MKDILIDQKTPTTFCKISFDDGDRWIHGIITYISTEKNIAEIFISAKYFCNYFSKGDRVIVKSLTENNEALFTGRIDKKIISIRKQSVTIRIDSALEFLNNRKYERFEVNYPTIIAVDKANKFSGIVSNISFGGIEVVTNTGLKEDSKVFIEISITNNKKISFIGLILRSQKVRNSHVYAIQIEEINEFNSNLLDELLGYLILNKNHIVYEFNIFNKLKFSIYIISALFLIIAIITFAFYKVI